MNQVEQIGVHPIPIDSSHDPELGFMSTPVRFGLWAVLAKRGRDMEGLVLKMKTNERWEAVVCSSGIK